MEFRNSGQIIIIAPFLMLHGTMTCSSLRTNVHLHADWHFHHSTALPVNSKAFFLENIMKYRNVLDQHYLVFSRTLTESLLYLCVHGKNEGAASRSNAASQCHLLILEKLWVHGLLDTTLWHLIRNAAENFHFQRSVKLKCLQPLMGDWKPL